METTQTDLEAAAFRRLIQHLIQDRPDVQNIDLMNMAGFCRNCLARWYQDAANERGVDMSKDQSRAAIYGMPYADWLAQNQTDADMAKYTAFSKAIKAHRP